MSSWSQKLIEVDVQLGSGATGPLQGLNGIGSSVALTGARASARISRAGTPVGSVAEVFVWGLPQSLMNSMAALGIAFNLVPRNIVTVKAGDSSGPLATAFQGIIKWAYGDYERQPDVPMYFLANGGVGGIVDIAPASSFKGRQSIAQIMQTLASQMNLNFENSGVTGTLSGEYVEGPLADQARQVAEHAGIEWGFVRGFTTLAIWPRGSSRTTTQTVVISPQTGMVGYPAFTPGGIIVKTVYNPALEFGGTVEVKSSIPQATGIWGIKRLDHNLDSLVPGGQWMTTCYAYPPGSAAGPP